MNDLTPVEPAVTPTEPASRPARKRTWMVGGLLGVALCAVLLGGTALAQSDSEGTDLRESFIDQLAEKLGLSSDELDAAIEETTNEMLDDAVADGRLSEERAEAFRERLGNGNGFFQMIPGRPWFGTHEMRPMQFGLESIAEELGITVDELKAEIESGSTLSEVITAHGSTVEAVVDALITDAKVELDDKVENGDLSQEQADRMLETMTTHLTRMLEGGFPGDCFPWLDRNGEDTQDSGDAEETSV